MSRSQRMSRLLYRCSIAFLLLFLIAALPALAQVSQPNISDGNSNQANPAETRHHGVAFHDNNAVITPFAAPAGAHLTYRGGPVISNVQVYQVLYGSGSYAPQISATTTPSIASFFGDIGNSTFLTGMLSEYNTNISGGTNQIIGAGTFAGQFAIVPAAGNNGSTITDTQIQSELLSQITAGHLPAPVLDAGGHPNTLYMIYFPPGKTISQGGSNSCQAGGFCAYHGTTSNTFNSHNVLYGVLPDMQAGSGCATGCGNSTVFNNYTTVSSHEYAEAITDAQVGIATVIGPPLAWYDSTNGEIGDICNGQQGSYAANGTTYTIQLEFSNAANNCILPPPNTGANFSLSASPSSLTITQGTSGSSTITVTPSGGFTGSVSLSNSTLPSGVTASFGTNPTTGSSVVTFTASSTATTGTTSITVTGTSGTLTHTTTISLTISSSSVATQLIVNPGFENGANAAPWTLTAGVINNSSSEPPHSGAWDAWLDGYGTTHTDTASQTVTIPSTATTATLTFWLHIDTAETTTTTAFDVLSVQVISGGVTNTLGTFSNLNKAAGYIQRSFNVIAFKGQTVTIRFSGREDTSLQTSFVIDDVNLNVQ